MNAETAVVQGKAEGDPAMAELNATRTVYETLKSLDGEAQKRVLDHVSGLLDVKRDARRQVVRQQDPSNGEQQDDADIQREEKTAPKYSTFAEVFDAAGPETQSQKALIAGYWLQVCRGAADFDGFSANKEMKQLGHGLQNITVAIEALKNEKPALALQIGKSGKSRQSRKTYKLTVAGIKSVEEMING
jgi:hypothetical protein